MKILLQAKSSKLKLKLEISSDDPFTDSVFSDPRLQLKKRLEAVGVGLRSELIMFLLDVERELDVK